MAALCQVKRVKLAQEVANLAGPTSIGSRASTLIRAGYIGGIKTPLKGLVGNASSLSFKTLAAQPAQAGVDYIKAVSRAAIENAKGNKVSPNQFREVINGTNLEGFDAMVKGIAQGTEEVLDGLRAGRQEFKNFTPKKLDDPSLMQRLTMEGSPFIQRVAAGVAEMKLRVVTANAETKLLDYTPTQYKHPLLQAATDAAFLAVEAVDRPFWYAAKEMSLVMQARLSAIKAGAKGAQINQIADQILKDPPDVMVAQAITDAQYVTFKDRGTMAKAAEAVKKFAEREAMSDNPGRAAAGLALSLGADVTIPFTGVPTSFATKGVELTPLGLLGLLANANKGGLTGARNSQLVANALLGTAGIALGYQWAKEGVLTGKLTAKEREDNPDAQEYSLNVGGRAFALQTLGPLSVSLFAGASLARRETKDPSISAAGMAEAVGRSALSQTVNSTYMQGVKQLVDAAGDEDKSAGSFFANVVPIPSLSTQIARFTDPQPREARGIGEKLLNKTPLSFLLPPATSSTGVLRERTMGERIANVVSPIAYRENTPSPALDELQRLGVNIGKPAKVIQKDNVKAELSPEGMKAITEEQGKRILPLVEQKLRDPEYKAWTDEKKQNYWEKVVAAQKARAKLEVRKQFSDTTSGFFTGARR